MPSPARYARVYIQLKTRSLEHAFDYAVPEEMADRIAIGSAVLVRFGRQKALGLVGAIPATSELPPEKLQAIEAILDYPPIPEKLMELAVWVSHYYYCSPAAALGLVLPPGGLPALVRQKVDGRAVYRLKQPRVGAKKARFVRLAEGGAGTSAVTEPLAEGGGRDTSAVAEPPAFRRTAARQRVLDALQAGEALTIPQLIERASTGRTTVNVLAELGVVEIFEREIHRDGIRYYGHDAKSNKDVSEPFSLNDAQEQALAAVVARLRQPDAADRSRPILLEGVAGAGKTEVYLQAITEAIASGGTRAGGSALVLVPEISLTHQAVRRLRRRFGDRVGVLHSGLSLGERYDEYMRIRAGRADVVIGPRSALFAPVPNLRLIILDEENDSSFKQENEPRYDARRTALKRARLEGAAIVYGSATPSMESYHLIRDRYELPERAAGASMPAVEIVDMKEETNDIFSARLLAGIEQNIRAGGKTILLLNSRGFARFMQCSHCGHVWKCPSCEVSLTMHDHTHRLLCHHCGHSEGMPDICPECNSSELSRWGIGTERLEREVRRLFPETPVFRLDADTAGGYGEAPRILDEFAVAGNAILVGTQMVAKGHHFPDVTLAAVINADLSLEFPEFRAEERTFSLLIQLSGRSGRAERPGKVIIQTWNGDIECIRMAADQAMAPFYEAELGRRRRLDYPPFTSLINIICLSREESKPEAAAAHLKQKLAPALEAEALLGPAPLFRLKGWARAHLLVKTTDVEKTLEAMKPVIEHFREPYRARGVRIVVDVDPQWLS